MNNPANEQTSRITDENRVPMGMPQLMLEVPAIPGYVLHWFADRPGRIARATRGGYEFVAPDEVLLNNATLAGDVADSGSTDLGSRVSVHGGVDEGGKGIRLYLMKVKQEWWDKDAALREEVSERIAETFRGGRTGAEKESGVDTSLRYAKVGQQKDNIFTRKTKRR